MNSDVNKIVAAAAVAVLAIGVVALDQIEWLPSGVVSPAGFHAEAMNIIASKDAAD